MEITALDKYTRAISWASLARNLSMTTAIGISSSLVTLYLITTSGATKLAVSLVIIRPLVYVYMYFYLLSTPSISFRLGLQTIKNETLFIWNNLGIKHPSLCGKRLRAYVFWNGSNPTINSVGLMVTTFKS